MKIKSRTHVYECLPPFLDNRKCKPEEQIVIGLKVVPMTEQDQYQREIAIVRAEHALDKAQELVTEKTMKLVEGKFEYIRGLIIEGVNDDGRELAFAEFYAEAPPEIVLWVSRAVLSTTELFMAERKNFVPGSSSL